MVGLFLKERGHREKRCWLVGASQNEHAPRGSGAAMLERTPIPAQPRAPRRAFGVNNLVAALTFHGVQGP